MIGFFCEDVQKLGVILSHLVLKTRNEVGKTFSDAQSASRLKQHNMQREREVATQQKTGPTPIAIIRRNTLLTKLSLKVKARLYSLIIGERVTK